MRATCVSRYVRMVICFATVLAAATSSLSTRSNILSPFRYVNKRGRHISCRISNGDDAPQATQSSSFDGTPVQYLKRVDSNNDSYRIAYRYFAPAAATENRACGMKGKSSPKSDNKPATVVFFLSNMSGTKSRSLQQDANKNGAGFLCFDYRGHGSSSGKFVDSTMHDWVDDARSMLDHAIFLSQCAHAQQHEDPRGELLQHIGQRTLPKVILVGSSMGAWIALRLAMEQVNLVSGVIGIGSAIDFTHYTFKNLTEEQQLILMTDRSRRTRDPVVHISSPYLEGSYPFSRALHESGNYYLLCHDLQGKDQVVNTNRNLNLSCPVRFLHGLEDDVIHWSTIINAAKCLKSKYHGKDVAVQLVDGDHRLSMPGDISVLLQTLDQFL